MIPFQGIRLIMLLSWGAYDVCSPDDRQYYTGRSLEERNRGDLAVDPIVAAVHYELADRYSALAARAGMGTPNLTLIHGGKDQIAA